MPEDQELQREAGVRVSAIDEGIEEQAEYGIEESEKHDRASWQVGSSRSAGPPVPVPSFLTAHPVIALAARGGSGPCCRSPTVADPCVASWSSYKPMRSHLTCAPPGGWGDRRYWVPVPI